MTAPESGSADSTSVGVLFVHGIGDQHRFVHLEAEARQIATALQAHPSVDFVQVVLRTRESAAFAAPQKTWEADDGAPVTLEVHRRNGTLVAIHLREVWWADLDEPSSVRNQARFWWWTLSLWATRGHVESEQPRYHKWMRPPTSRSSTSASSDTVPPASELSTSERPTLERPKSEPLVSARPTSDPVMSEPRTLEPPRSRPPASRDGETPGVSTLGRFCLFGVAVVLLLSLLSLSALNFVLRRLNLVRHGLPGPSILFRYIGDVRLYQQKASTGKGPLAYVSERPRIAIRRRMIRELVRTALAKHDRWYVLAHSQGTVLAFNGLMDPDARLAHYLDPALWKRCENARLTRSIDAEEALDEEELRRVLPRRPTWHRGDRALNRKALFGKLRGVLMYGSPLEKFASLWPAIVPLNRDEQVFRNDFQWINIVDPSDPVAGRITRFAPNTQGGPTPRSTYYKAGHIPLVSHVKYLDGKPKGRDRLVNVIADWLLDGGPFAPPPPRAGLWPGRREASMLAFVRIGAWFVAGGALAAFVAWYTRGLAAFFRTAAQPAQAAQAAPWDAFLASYSTTPLWLAALWCTGVAATVVLLIGLIRLARGRVEGRSRT